jgi:hypothetical protein
VEKKKAKEIAKERERERERERVCVCRNKMGKSKRKKTQYESVAASQFLAKSHMLGG